MYAITIGTGTNKKYWNGNRFVASADFAIVQPFSKAKRIADGVRGMYRKTKVTLEQTDADQYPG